MKLLKREKAPSSISGLPKACKYKDHSTSHRSIKDDAMSVLMHEAWVEEVLMPRRFAEVCTFCQGGR